MSEIKDIRIDKYLWAIRIFKTRSLASTAIDGGKVKMDDDTIKSSRKVKVGDIYDIKKTHQTYKIEVTQILKNRVSAEKAKDYYNLLEFTDTFVPKNKSAFVTGAPISREKGKGRPTKKERREIDEFTDE